MYTDEVQIKAIITEFQEPLEGFIKSRVASDRDAEDILQEVWFQLSKTLDIGSLDNPGAWLYHVTRNKIIDHYRKKSPDWLEDFLQEEDGAFDWDNEEDTPEDIYFRQQFWEELYEALDSLPEKQRIVFVLNEIEGITLREIAEQYGEKLKTIISRKGYAVRQLRRRLEFLFNDFMDD